MKISYYPFSHRWSNVKGIQIVIEYCKQSSVQISKAKPYLEGEVCDQFIV